MVSGRDLAISATKTRSSFQQSPLSSATTFLNLTSVNTKYHCSYESLHQVLPRCFKKAVGFFRNLGGLHSHKSNSPGDAPNEERSHEAFVLGVDAVGVSPFSHGRKHSFFPSWYSNRWMSSSLAEVVRGTYHFGCCLRPSWRIQPIPGLWLRDLI